MRPAVMVRLAVAGNRTDVLRTALTAVSAGLAVVALLAAATVASIRGFAERYTNALLVEPGLRPGVVLGLVLVTLPVVALAGQCIRLGTPARDRRLAAYRLAGATPRETVLLATAETAVAGLVGAVLGLGAYLVMREALTQRDPAGRLRLPTDVLPPTVTIAVLLAGVPLLAALISAVLMRRVIATPLGVVRRIRTRGPRPWPGLLILAGLAVFWVPFGIPEDWHRPAWLPALPSDRLAADLVLGGGVALTMIGVILGTGWISHTAGRLLRRYGRGPATLLAGQRLIVDPWSGSRNLAALLAALVAGAIALAFRADQIATFAAYDRYNSLLANPDDGGFSTGSDRGFYLGGIRLVLVAVAVGAVVATAGLLVALTEGIVARRRTYAALTATGVGRRTLSAAVLWQTFAPLVPAALVAMATGAGLMRMIQSTITLGGDFTACLPPTPDAAPADCVEQVIHQPLVVMPVPVPFAHLALLGGATLLAVLVAAGAGLLVLRSSTDLDELRTG